jgi:hypothetical protein
MEGDELILIDCLSLILKFIEGRSGKFGIQKSIQYYVKHLYYRYGITRDQICSRLFYDFRNRKRHIKYDPSRSPLEKYVAWFAYYGLLAIKDQCLRHLNKSKTVPLSELENGEKISRIGCSTQPYEKQGIEALTNSVSPEDELIGKELLLMAEDFFNEHDLAVLLGGRDRHEEAVRLQIDYYTYCKRLNRKILRFRTHLENIGYFD